MEGHVTRRTYGILAGILGSAVGVWWWARQRSGRTAQAVPERGTTIFSNTPTATPLSDGVV